MGQNAVAVIGYGAIGEVLVHGLLGRDRPRLAGVMVRPRQLDATRAALPGDVAVVDDLGAMLALRPGLVVESAGQGAVLDHGKGGSRGRCRPDDRVDGSACRRGRARPPDTYGT